MNGPKLITWTEVFSSPPEFWTDKEKNALMIAAGTFGNVLEAVRRYVNLWANSAITDYLVYADIDASREVSPSGQFFNGFFDNVYKEMAFYHHARQSGGDSIATVWNIVRDQLVRFGLLEG